MGVNRRCVPVPQKTEPKLKLESLTLNSQLARVDKLGTLGQT